MECPHRLVRPSCSFARSRHGIASIIGPTEATHLLSDKLEQIVASYFADLRDKRGLGAGTPERSYYPALAHGAPIMEVPYNDLMDRIRKVCVGAGPSASSVVQACRQISWIALRVAPQERVLEWDDQELTGTMSVVDPYFLFYLRRSKKLEILARAKT